MFKQHLKDYWTMLLCAIRVCVVLFLLTAFAYMFVPNDTEPNCKAIYPDVEKCTFYRSK